MKKLYAVIVALFGAALLLTAPLQASGCVTPEDVESGACDLIQ